MAAPRAAPAEISDCDRPFLSLTIGAVRASMKIAGAAAPGITERTMAVAAGGGPWDQIGFGFRPLSIPFPRFMGLLAVIAAGGTGAILIKIIIPM